MPALTAALVTALLATLIALVAAPVSASGATTGPSPYGRFASALQLRDGSITVTGSMYDRNHPQAAVTGCVAVHGTCVHRVHANRPSVAFDKRHHITGRHGFSTHVGSLRRGLTLELRVYTAHHLRLAAVHVLSPGARVVQIAARYVGKAAYVYGGASPRGFDCSGLAMYAYRHAQVAGLPHNAEAQRHARHMHRIPRSKARPGDLIFYFAGGSAYHVAIYAGRGREYSAADPAEGIVYHKVWSHNIEFRTDWH